MSVPTPGKWAAQHLTDEQINTGFGDPNAPLAEGERVVYAAGCNHPGCKWTLDIEWRRGGTTTRLRGYGESMALCRAHLELHQLPKGPERG